MSKSYQDLKTEFGTMAGCMQASESMMFLKCREARDETVAIMQIELNGAFQDVVCKQEDLCALQEAVASVEGKPEKKARYQEELHIAQRDLMGHEMYRRG